MKVSTVIVDDEIPARDELEYLLNKENGLFKIVGRGQSGEDAVELCKTLKPDVVFLDIHMYGMNGLEAAKTILNITPTPLILFATAYDKYAVEAFEVNAVDYILKPFSEQRMRITINKVQHLMKDKNVQTANIKSAIHTLEQGGNISGKVGLWVDGRFLLVDEKDIVYIEAQRKHTLIYCVSNQYESSTPFGEFEQKLDRNNFFRVHRSYIINLIHIKEVGFWVNNNLSVIMKGFEKSIIPVSRGVTREFKDLIGM